MVDYTQVNNTEFTKENFPDSVLPGKHNVEYVGCDEGIVSQKDAYKDFQWHKLKFRVENSQLEVGILLADKGDDSALIKTQTVVSAIGNAMGINSVSSSDQFLGKSINVDLVMKENGYLDIDLGYSGKSRSCSNIRPVADAVKAPEVKESSEITDENIPF